MAGTALSFGDRVFGIVIVDCRSGLCEIVGPLVFGNGNSQERSGSP